MIYTYCVPHIEVEFGWGSRPNGYEIFLDEKVCKSQTLKSLAHAHARVMHNGECYFGPEMPARYYKVPFDCLEPEIANEAKGYLMTKDLVENEKPFAAWSSDRWRPEVRSSAIYIETNEK